MTRALFLLAAALGAFTLAGCSSAPDSADVEKAIEQNITDTLAQQRALVHRLSGPGADRVMAGLAMPQGHDIDITDVAIQDSERLKSGDYRLEVTYEAQLKDISRRSSTQVILGRRDGEWTVLN